MHIGLNSVDNNLIIALIVFIAGLIIGSFLNIIIYKIPRKISVFKPYAVCFDCRHNSPAIHSFPVLAALSGKNKCNNCGNSIPAKSFMVEILHALIYVLVYLNFGISLKALSGAVLSSILIAVAFIDWEYMIIPNILVLPFTVVGLIISIIGNLKNWWMPLVFSLGAFVFMFIIHIIYPKGMGMGDVKLALMMGAFLVKNVIFGIFAGFLLGAVSGIILIALKKKKLKQFIPFGPFLSAGGMAALFFGDFITGWYLSHF